MPKIAFLLGDLGPHKSEVVSLVRSYLDLEISKILQLAGSDSPLFTRRLFDRSDPRFTVELQKLLARLEELQVNYSAYELLDSQEFSVAEAGKFYQIDAQRLQNMILAHDASLVEQSRSGFLEDFDFSSEE